MIFLRLFTATGKGFIYENENIGKMVNFYNIRDTFAKIKFIPFRKQILERGETTNPSYSHCLLRKRKESFKKNPLTFELPFTGKIPMLLFSK